VAGGNYGWPTVEGQSTDTRFRNPIAVWTTAESSPSGATIDGSTLYVAALRGQRLWSLPLNGAGGAGTPVALLQGRYGRLRTVEKAPDGSLWVTTSNRDGRGTPVADDDRVIRFPALGGPTSPPPSSAPPSSPPPSSPPPSSPPPSAGACSVRWEANQWSTGFTANIGLTNLGPARSSWRLTFTFGGNQRVSNAWNATVTQSGTAVTARNVAWNGTLATGATTTFGLQATYSGSNARPSDFRVDGAACAVTG
jgi:hypothetical protein